MGAFHSALDRKVSHPLVSLYVQHLFFLRFTCALPSMASLPSTYEHGGAVLGYLRHPSLPTVLGDPCFLLGPTHRVFTSHGTSTSAHAGPSFRDGCLDTGHFNSSRLLLILITTKWKRNRLWPHQTHSSSSSEEKIEVDSGRQIFSLPPALFQVRSCDKIHGLY